MILYPAIGELSKRVDSRYTLVVETAKRARQLTDGATPTVESTANKSVSVAVQEVNEGNVSFIRTKDGSK